MKLHVNISILQHQQWHLNESWQWNNKYTWTTQVSGVNITSPLQLQVRTYVRWRRFKSGRWRLVCGTRPVSYLVTQSAAPRQSVLPDVLHSTVYTGLISSPKWVHRKPTEKKGKGRGGGATHKLRGSSDSRGTMKNTEYPSSAGWGGSHQAAINQSVDLKKKTQTNVDVESLFTLLFLGGG